MFGYVRPVLDRLSQEDRARFQSAYCGLCYELDAQYGFFARFILHYDFTFLAILLSDGTEEETAFRCPCKSFKKNQRMAASSALELAADESVILTYWKLIDEIEDSTGLHTLKYKFLKLLASRAYRKAAAKRKSFADAVESNLKELRCLELEKTASLDRPADRFARLLASAAEGIGTEQEQAIYRQLLYQLGRWIYLVDALDDLKEDAAEGKYNPIYYRFGLKDGTLDGENRRRMIATIDHSANLVASAYALTEHGPWSGVLENIIYYGLPVTGRLVLEGKWNASADGGPCHKSGHGIELEERIESINDDRPL